MDYAGKIKERSKTVITLVITDDHNASCVIYKDNCIIFAAQEERFLRENNQGGLN